MTARLSITSARATAFGGLFAMASGIGIGRFIYTPNLPLMIQTLGLSKSAAGLIASANFAGYLCGALLAARLALPGSRRTWLLVSLAASAASTGLMGVITEVPDFLAMRFAGGVASALILIMSSALVLERLAEAGQQRLAALHFSGVGIGIAASALAVALLLRDGQDWTHFWFAGGALALLGLLAVIALVPDTAGPRAAPGPLKTAPMSGPLRRMAVAYGLFGFGYVITATFLVTIIRDAADLRPLEPIIWIIVGLAAAPSVMFWGAVARRLGLSRGFAWAALTQAAGVVASVAWPSNTGIILAASLLGGTFMGLTALGLMRARELATGEPRRALALLTGSFGVGQIVGPIFAGALYDAFGNLAAASMAAAGALVLAAWLARR